MRLNLNGKVFGHRLFYPDPKDHPSLELVKVEIEISPSTRAAEHCKAMGRAIVIVHPGELKDLDLGQFVALSLADTQQRLALQERRAHTERAGQGAEPR